MLIQCSGLPIGRPPHIRNSSPRQRCRRAFFRSEILQSTEPSGAQPCDGKAKQARAAMGKSQPPTTPPHQRRTSFGQRWSVLDTSKQNMDKQPASWRKEHQPLCVMCSAEGRTTAAEVVDHIQPHRGDRALFWDSTNWQSLCKQHHDSDKARLERGSRERAKFDPKGRVVW